MNLLIILLLSLVQGVSEFLPISSSGHLIILYKLFNITNGTLFISIILHFATLLSIIVYYRKTLVYYIKNFKSKTTLKFFITTLTTVLLVLLLKNFLLDSFDGKYLIICFITTSILLFISEQINLCHKHSNYLSNNNNSLTKTNNLRFNSISFFKSFIVGISQATAVLPGISRSGSTLSTLLILKSDKKESADYCFLISIPIILGSLLFEIIDYIKNPEIIPFNVFEISFGFIVAFIIGYLSIKFLLKLLKKQKLYIFSFYLLILSIVLIFVKF